jgi:hypothetical protein
MLEFTLTLHKFVYFLIRGKNKRVGIAGTMLDTGYWISSNAPGVKSRNIQHPETSIQDHVVLPMTFIKTP